MNKISCEICRDLIPMVQDGVASAESCAAVEEHIQSCEACRALYQGCEPPEKDGTDGAAALGRLKKQLRMLIAFLMFFAIFCGVNLASSEDQFYNVLLMPVIGALGYCVFRWKAAYEVPVLLLFTGAAIHILDLMRGLQGMDWFGVLWWSVMLGIFAFFGTVTAGLFHAAFRKMQGRSRFTKAAAGIGGGALLVALLVFGNAMVGNPFSYFLVSQGAEKYLAETYPGTDYQFEKVQYSFKDGSYGVWVTSPTSADTKFRVSFSGLGKPGYDSYEYDIGEKQVVAHRIDWDYRQLCESVIESPRFPYKVDMSVGSLAIGGAAVDAAEEPGVQPERISQELLELDRQYDVAALGAKHGVVFLYVEVQPEEITPEKAAEILLETKRLMELNHVPFFNIDFTLEPLRNEDGTREAGPVIDLMNFAWDDIYEEGLVDRVKANRDETLAFYARMDAERK